MTDFFVSFNRNDKPWADWIAWALEEAGYKVTYQNWDFRAGQNFALEMDKALANSDRVLAVLSQSYLDATYTHPEWAGAFTRDPMGAERKLIPIRVAPCKPKGLLANVIHIDLVGLDAAAATAALLDGLKERGKPAVAPAFPGTAAADATPSKPEPLFPGSAPETARDDPPRRDPPPPPPPAPDSSPGGSGGGASQTTPPRYTSWKPVWILLGIVVGLLVLSVWQADRIHQNDLMFVGVTIYVLIGLVAAIVLFGILKSSGLLKGRAFGSAIEFGGPAAIVVLFFLAGTLGAPSGEPVTMQFELLDASKETHVFADGTIEFALDGQRRGNVNGGYAVVSGVPYKKRRSEVTIADKLDDDYRVVNHKIKLDPNKVIPLYVEKIIPPRTETAPPVTTTPGAETTTTTAPTTTTAGAVLTSTETSTTATATSTVVSRPPTTEELQAIYTEQAGDLITLLDKESSELTNADRTRIAELAKSLSDIQDRIGEQGDWKRIYKLLKDNQPVLLNQIKIRVPTT